MVVGCQDEEAADNDRLDDEFVFDASKYKNEETVFPEPLVEEISTGG